MSAACGSRLIRTIDIIIAGAMLAQPLPHAANWDQLSRRQAGIYVAGLATTADTPLPGRPPNRAQLEAGFVETSSRPGNSGPANE